MLYTDARKEFSLMAQPSFGVDGNTYQKQRDFEQVRREFENNLFVQTVQTHIKNKTDLGDKIIKKLQYINAKKRS